MRFNLRKACGFGLIRLGSYLFCVPFIFGCGLSKVAEDTLSLVGESNHLQEQLLEHMKEMNHEMGGLHEDMRKTNQAVHLQILTIALQNLFEPENTKVLPIPTRMMSYADVFAKEAYPEEVVKIGNLLLTEAKTHPYGSDSEKQAQIQEKLIRLTGLGLIAAFLSQEGLEKLLVLEVDGHGRYESTAYAMVALRYAFVRDFLLAQVLDNPPNLGGLRAAVMYFKQMKYLTKLPYASGCELNVPPLEIHLRTEVSDLRKWASKAKRAFKRLEVTPEVQALLSELTV